MKGLYTPEDTYMPRTLAVLQHLLYGYVKEVYSAQELSKALLSEGIHIEVTAKNINIILVV